MDFKGKRRIEGLRWRARVLRGVRARLDGLGFLEVTTPVLLPYSSLEKEIHPYSLVVGDDVGEERGGFLRVSPEFSLKKLLAMGHPRIYEIGSCFRNRESWGSREHSSEFSLLEWYEAGCNLEGIMDRFEDLMGEFGGLVGVDGGGGRRVSVREAFLRYVGIDLDGYGDWGGLLEEVNRRRSMGAKFREVSDAFYWIFLVEVEPRLGELGNVLLYHYPSFQGGFSKLCEGDERYARRFEAYASGLEIGNAFEELTDVVRQRELLEAGLEWHKERGLGVSGAIDEDFLRAVERLGLGGEAYSGIAVGVERLLMGLCGVRDIREVMAFSSGELFGKDL